MKESEGVPTMVDHHPLEPWFCSEKGTTLKNWKKKKKKNESIANRAAHPLHKYHHLVIQTGIHFSSAIQQLFVHTASFIWVTQ